MTTEEAIAALGFERGATAAAFVSNPKAGTLADARGGHVSSLPESLVRGLRFVLEKERAGAWAAIVQKSAATCGRALAVNLDGRLRELQAPLLGAMSLEAALDILARLFALHAWGVLAVDTSHAGSHGLMVAHVEHGFFASALRDANGHTDPFVAGVLQGYCAQVSGQPLICADLTSAGAAKCTFILTTPERLAPVTAMIGREPVETILARLKA